MRRRHVFIGIVLAFGGSLAPVATRAAAPGELTVRSSRVDYEVGQRVDWTVDWRDFQPGDADRDDVIVNLNGPHDFVIDSIEMPRGWSVMYSEDGVNFETSPTTKVSHLKFAYHATGRFPAAVAAVALPGDILVQTPIPQPIPPITTARNGGDGYIPILAGDRIYGVWHHMAAGANPEPHMVCIDTLTGKACPNYPKPLDWQTSYNQGQGIFIDGKIYIKNRDATTHGVYCWDTATEDSCGYRPVAILGPVTGTAGGNGGWDQFSSPVLHRGRLFFAGHDFRVYCFNPESETACADYGPRGKPTARFGERHETTRRINDVVYHDGKMIFSLATSWGDVPVPLGAKDSCFDLDAGAPCQDWGLNGVVTETTGTAYTFTRYDAAGNPIGYCHGVQSGAAEVPLQSTVPCYDFAGRNRTTIPSAQAFGQFRPYNVEEGTLGTRTMFGRYSTVGAYCYNWATSAPCAGTYYDVNGRSTQSLAEHFYGFVPRGDCMVGLGHRGIFMSIDPLTGGSPCRQVSESKVLASAESRYCRDTKHLDGWRLAIVSDISSTDVSRLEATISDGTNVANPNLRAGSASLTALDATKSLRVDVQATVNALANPWSKGEPMLNLLYSGSSQFCFQTVAKATTAPIGVEVESNGLTDKEEVVVDPTPLDIGEPNESSTFVGKPTNDARLPATGSSPVLPVAIASAACAGGVAMVVRRRAVRPR